MGGETYYVAGIGLNPNAEAVVTDNANTATPTNTTVAAPAKQSKYTCVIEAGDGKLFESKTYAQWGNAIRKDYTTNELYIYLRDQLEDAYNRGEKGLEVEYSIQSYDFANMTKNICVDFMKSHPDTEMWVGALCPTASYDNPFDGTQYANYYIGYARMWSFLNI